MRIALISEHYLVSAGRCMADAWRRLGVDVRSLGNAHGTEIWDLRLDPKFVWQPDGEPQAFWPDWRPDLVVIMDGEPYHHQRYHDIPHAVYGIDNHVLNFRQPGVSHYFLAHKHGQLMPVDAPDTTWLPCAYDPIIFTPSPIPWRQRKFDVALIGFLYAQRKQLVGALARCNFTLVAGTGAVYEEYRDIYHNSRISLCLSGRSDVAMRVFETAAMRCLILSDPCLDYPDLKPKGFVLFRNTEEVINSIRLLLANPQQAESLIEQSYQWAKPHTWDARAQFICDWYREIYGTPPSER